VGAAFDKTTFLKAVGQESHVRGIALEAACQITHGNGLADCPKLPKDIAQRLRQLQLGQNGRAPAAYSRAEGVCLLDQLVEQGQNVRRGGSGHPRAAYLNSSLLVNFMDLVHYVLQDFNSSVPDVISMNLGLLIL